MVPLEHYVESIFHGVSFAARNFGGGEATAAVVFTRLPFLRLADPKSVIHLNDKMTWKFEGNKNVKYWGADSGTIIYAHYYSTRKTMPTLPTNITQ